MWFLEIATMMGMWRCLVLILAFAAAATVRVRCQTDSLGFINIDCGLPENTTYIESTVKITYVSDFGFTETGVNRNISNDFIANKQPYSRHYLTLRSFPDGDRNCYTLRSLTSGSKYLLRAFFLYGNYDGLNKPPIFDVYLGVDLWGTVNVTEDKASMIEIIAFSPSDYLQVCLVNKKLGTPIISSLVLRPLATGMYPGAANATQSLVLVSRDNMGPPFSSAIVRYPDDPFDRLWFPYNYDGSQYTKVSTTSPVANAAAGMFEPPQVVMQTALTPVNSSMINYSWQPDPSGINSFFIVMLVSELQALPANQLREFNVFLNDVLFLKDPYSPEVLMSDGIYAKVRGLPKYNITFNATRRSTLPPILNAVELYTIVPVNQAATDNSDVSAITTIKARYHVKRNWDGDPCVPKAFVWDGLNCSYAAESPSRVTSLELSKSGLSGAIIASFADLKALTYLDLSQNNLSGPIPDFLEKISSLVYLDISGNKLDGPVPAGLLKRSQEGSLTLRIGDICSDSSTCELKKKSNKVVIIASIIIIVILVGVAIAVATFMCPGTKEGKSSIRGDPSIRFDRKNFTREDIKKITNDFHKKIGEGASGDVYAGKLDDGTEVAVKMNKSSSNSFEKLGAEAQVMMKVHHKSLVSMIGYCMDTESLALVFELMSGGTLLERLRVRESNMKPLTWVQRLRIALDSAEGLDYLHTKCSPPIIHRDVKSANILLSDTLEAKVADFGLSKAFDTYKTHISTQGAGTVGYLDPEYYYNSKLSEKSDVYSFGVVLLELVTGKPPMLQAPENCHVAIWVQQRLRYNIEHIADPNMKGIYDVNSLWKVTELALKCTGHSRDQRPLMKDVAVQLKDCLQLAISATDTVHQPYEGMDGQNLNAEADNDKDDNILETRPLSLSAVYRGPAGR